MPLLKCMDLNFKTISKYLKNFKLCSCTCFKVCDGSFENILIKVYS